VDLTGAGAAGALERLVPGMSPLIAPLAAALAADARVVERPAGTVMFDVGSPCSGLLLLERGVVRVSRLGPEGRELLLYRVRPGETCVLTLSCLLGRAEYPARGVAESALHGVLLSRDMFERLTGTSEPFRRFVFDSFTERLTGLLDLTAAVAFDRLDQRLAGALLAHVEATRAIELAATHQQLAQELGTVRERVSRLLESFEARGAVELGRGRIVVRDKTLLGRIAAREG
jgi:CRP/FNR family transcriptional regulator